MNKYWLLSFLLIYYSCAEKSKSYHEKKNITYFDNKNIKETHFFLNESKDSVLIQEYFEDGGLKVEYLEVDKKIEGILKIYYPNGQLRESKPYRNDVLHGKYYVYEKDGKRSVEYVFFEGETTYKKVYNYLDNGKIENIEEELSLIVTSNNQPFIVGEESIISMKLPIDIKDGYTYIKFDLKEEEFEGQKFAPYYPDSIPIYSDDFMNLYYKFDKPCKIFVLGAIYYKKNSVSEKIGVIGKELNVVASTGLNL